MNIIPFANLDISSIVEMLEEGQTIIYPTETCYGLGCDATNQKAVDAIFDIKRRDKSKGLLIAMSSIEMAKEYVVWNDTIEMLVQRYLPGPLTIETNKLPGHNLAEGIGINVDVCAFRISSHPFVQEITESFGKPIVTTSANISNMDSPYSINTIKKMFQDQKIQPDILIDAGDLPEQSPSTIVRVKDGTIEVLRQGDIIITQ